jgi:hypothetical protein
MLMFFLFYGARHRLPEKCLDGMTAIPPPVLDLHRPFHLNLTLNFNPLGFGAKRQGGTKIKIRIKNENEGKDRGEAALAMVCVQALG